MQAWGTSSVPSSNPGGCCSAVGAYRQCAEADHAGQCARAARSPAPRPAPTTQPAGEPADITRRGLPESLNTSVRLPALRDARRAVLGPSAHACPATQRMPVAELPADRGAAAQRVAQGRRAMKTCAPGRVRWLRGADVGGDRGVGRLSGDLQWHRIAAVAAAASAGQVVTASSNSRPRQARAPEWSGGCWRMRTSSIRGPPTAGLSEHSSLAQRYGCVSVTR